MQNNNKNIRSKGERLNWEPIQVAKKKNVEFVASLIVGKRIQPITSRAKLLMP